MMQKMGEVAAKYAAQIMEQKRQVVVSWEIFPAFGKEMRS